MNIRAATIEDLDTLVALHYRCYTPKEHLAMVLGRSFMVDVYRWLLTSDKTLAMVAETEEGVIGILIVYNGLYHRHMFSHNKRSAVKAFVRRPWLIFNLQILKRCVRAFLMSDPLENSLKDDNDVAHISWVGVAPEYRRGGVAFALNQRMMQECCERNWLKLRAGIYSENTSSRRMYEKLGFKEVLLSPDRVVVMFDYDEPDSIPPSTEQPRRPH